MAYHQHQQHDPYANAYPDYPPANDNTPNFAYPRQQQHVQNDFSHPQTAYSYDNHANWDAKSGKSYSSTYAGSQAHLNPQYEMSQVSVPSMPSVPYQGADYPPQQRPGYAHSQYSAAGYSVAREKLMKRRSVRQVALQEGNLVLDMPVPSHIVPKSMDNSEEFTKLRYTAATCDPDDFMRNKYSLRPYLMGRRTELFIVMTMYNEDEVLFCRTMNAYVPSCFWVLVWLRLKFGSSATIRLSDGEVQAYLAACRIPTSNFTEFLHIWLCQN